MANGWTIERRRRQAELIQSWRPWERSTGLKTADGKAKVSGNAYKGGMRATLRKLSWVLRELEEQQELWCVMRNSMEKDLDDKTCLESCVATRRAEDDDNSDVDIATRWRARRRKEKVQRPAA